MLQIDICDDEKSSLFITRHLVRQIISAEEGQISAFLSPGTLLQAARRSGKIPDIAIVDIQMEEEDGISLARQLKLMSQKCQVIFISSYLKYATDVYEVEHTYFILKSEMHERIGPAIEKALEALKNAPAEEPMLVIRNTSEIRRIPFSSILYIERFFRKSNVVTVQGSVISGSSPETLAEELPAGLFLRSHYSYWVNTGKIQTMEKNAFIMNNGNLIPISRSYKQDARDRFFEILADE